MLDVGLLYLPICLFIYLFIYLSISMSMSPLVDMRTYNTIIISLEGIKGKLD